MHALNLFLPLLFASTPLKENIDHLEKTQDYFSLSIAYLDDQEIEKSFRAFLKAIEVAPLKNPPPMTAVEKSLFEEGVALYLKENSHPENLSTLILEKYEAISKAHPEFYHLNLLIAVSYANLSSTCADFQRFFNTFYAVYPYVSSEFLTFKTLGIMHLRLMQIAQNETIREAERNVALVFLHKALETNENDPTLFKILMIQAIEKKEKSSLLSYLEKMVSSSVVMPRKDICFTINAALDCNRVDLGEKLLALAKKEYDYSRAIIEAEACLKKWKEKASAITNS